MNSKYQTPQPDPHKGTGLPGLNQYLARINVLAQGTYTVTQVRLKPSVSSQALYHWATALPWVCGWCLLNLLKFLISLTSYVLGTQESSRWNWPFEHPQHVLWFGKRKSDFASSTLILRLWLILFCLIWFFTSHQQSFSYIGTGLPGLNQY